MKTLKGYLKNDKGEEVIICEMSSKRKDFKDDVVDICMRLEDNIILSIEGYLQDNTSTHHWMDELRAIIEYVRRMTLKNSNNYASRKSVIEEAIDIRDLRVRHIFDIAIEQVNDKEEREAQRRRENGDICYPIVIKSSNKLFDIYNKVLDLCIEKMSSSERLNYDDITKCIDANT